MQHKQPLVPLEHGLQSTKRATKEREVSPEMYVLCFFKLYGCWKPIQEQISCYIFFLKIHFFHHRHPVRIYNEAYNTFGISMNIQISNANTRWYPQVFCPTHRQRYFLMLFRWCFDGWAASFNRFGVVRNALVPIPITHNPKPLT